MRILITGATGLIGSKITELCHEKDIPVHFLTTSREKMSQQENYRGFYWDPSKGEIDLKCFEEVVAIIHLAGASVFQSWTKKNKQKIVDSRLDSSRLLYDSLKKIKHSVAQINAASAIGYYPSSFDKLYFEYEKNADDSFLGHLVEKWEGVNKRFEDLGLKVGIFRTGLVLSKEDGALEQMKKPIKFGVGAATGNGRQWQSWIHIEDMAKIYLFAVENGLQGVYNGVASSPVTQKEMMKKVAKQMGKKIWLPNIPVFMMKLVYGEMAYLLLSSQLVSGKKIEDAGFHFKYTRLSKALEDLLA